MRRERPSVDRIREVVEYNPADGIVRWRVKLNRCLRVGDIVGCLDLRGYLKTRIDGTDLMLHRVAWACHFGEWPANEIDHINGNKTDNRIQNLRDVTRKVNAQNVHRPFRNNTVGLMGVVRDHGRFSARLSINGKAKHIGMFATPEEAHAAYLDAKRRLHEGNTL